MCFEAIHLKRARASLFSLMVSFYQWLSSRSGGGDVETGRSLAERRAAAPGRDIPVIEVPIPSYDDVVNVKTPPGKHKLKTLPF